MSKEILIPISVMLISIVFLDPFMYLMPQSLIYILVTLLLLVSVIYSLLIWREKPLDEREYMHRAYAGRIAYLAGVIVLVIGIVYQVLVVHSVDIFLVATLVGMTIAKYAAYTHVQQKN